MEPDLRTDGEAFGTELGDEVVVFAEFGDDVPRLIAVVIAGAVIWRTRNVPASLVVGMGTLWLILWLS